MTYPLESLAIIAPTIFIILMIAMPAIGALGGWKRAAYWGGGNLLFYVIGLLVWNFTSGGIVGLFTPLLESLAPGADFSKIAVSVTAPIFFIMVMAIGELLLLINYYAWFKRVVGLKKYKKVKRQDKKTHAIVVEKVKVEHNYSTPYKIVSRVAGGVGMGLLTIPTTFAFTDATYFLTTSVTTRNGLSQNLYDTMHGVTNKVSWFSYYSDDTYKDFNSLYSALAMATKKITVKLPGRETAEEVTAIDALKITFDEGLGNLLTETISSADTPEEKIDNIIAATDNIAESWNAIMDQAGQDMDALFSSENATEIVKDVLGIQGGNVLQHDWIQGNYSGEDSIFYQAVEKYQDKAAKGEVIAVQQVDVSQESYDNMVNALMSCYTFEEGEHHDEDVAAFKGCMNDLLALLFK